MNKIVSGYGTTTVMLKELHTLHLGKLITDKEFKVSVDYFYASGHPATEFEPAAPEEFFVKEVKMSRDTGFIDWGFNRIRFSAGSEVLSMLSEQGIYDVITAVHMQCRYVETPFSFACGGRPEPDEVARRELGFHLR